MLQPQQQEVKSPPISGRPRPKTRPPKGRSRDLSRLSLLGLLRRRQVLLPLATVIQHADAGRALGGGGVSSCHRLEAPAGGRAGSLMRS